MKAVIVFEIEDVLYENLHNVDIMLTDKIGLHYVYPTIDVRPMPKKKNTDFHPNVVYANGWNDCIKEITGETE